MSEDTKQEKVLEDKDSKENNVEEAEDDSILRVRRRIRIATFVFAIFCTIVLAITAGAMIAMWDMGKSYKDLSAVMHGTYVSSGVEVLRQDASTQKTEELTAYEAAKADESEDSVESTLTEENTDLNSNHEENETSQKNGGINVTNEVLDNLEAEELVAEDIAQSSELQGIDEVDATEIGADVDLESLQQGTAYADPNAGYPLPFTTVDYSYFADALFIGDSRMEGFGMYSGLQATYYTAVGFQLHKYETMKAVRTSGGKVAIFDAIPYDAFTKIYIKVGLNELGGSEADFEAKYAELIQRLREYEPRAIIYIHGLLPVTAAKSASDKTHNNTNINNRNDALRSFSISQRAYFLDVGSALMEADGSLPAEMTGDGIHLKAQYMEIWKEYLRTHAVVVP